MRSTWQERGRWSHRDSLAPLLLSRGAARDTISGRWVDGRRLHPPRDVLNSSHLYRNQLPHHIRWRIPTILDEHHIDHPQIIIPNRLHIPHPDLTTQPSQRPDPFTQLGSQVHCIEIAQSPLGGGGVKSCSIDSGVETRVGLRREDVENGLVRLKEIRWRLASGQRQVEGDMGQHLGWDGVEHCKKHSGLLAVQE